MSNDLKHLNADIGAYTGAAFQPIWKLTEGFGQITIKEAYITGIGAGTAIGLILATATDVGTPAVSGTLASFAGTVVYAAGVVFAATVSDASADPGTAGAWLGVIQTSGTAPATARLHITYVDGV